MIGAGTEGPCPVGLVAQRGETPQGECELHPQGVLRRGDEGPGKALHSPLGKAGWGQNRVQAQG